MVTNNSCRSVYAEGVPRLGKKSWGLLPASRWAGVPPGDEVGSALRKSIHTIPLKSMLQNFSATKHLIMNKQAMNKTSDLILNKKREMVLLLLWWFYYRNYHWYHYVSIFKFKVCTNNALLDAHGASRLQKPWAKAPAALPPKITKIWRIHFSLSPPPPLIRGTCLL